MKEFQTIRQCLNFMVVLVNDFEGGLISMGNLCLPGHSYCKESRENFNLMIDNLLTYGNNYTYSDTCFPAGPDSMYVLKNCRKLALKDCNCIVK